MLFYSLIPVVVAARVLFFLSLFFLTRRPQSRAERHNDNNGREPTRGKWAREREREAPWLACPCSASALWRRGKQANYRLLPQTQWPCQLNLPVRISWITGSAPGGPPYSLSATLAKRQRLHSPPWRLDMDMEPTSCFSPKSRYHPVADGRPLSGTMLSELITPGCSVTHIYLSTVSVQFQTACSLMPCCHFMLCKTCIIPRNSQIYWIYSILCLFTRCPVIYGNETLKHVTFP